MSIVQDSTIETVLRAVLHNRMIEFDYKKEDGTATSRAIIPLDFVKSDKTNEWRVFGYCTLREQFRAFRHDRISNLSLSEQGTANQYKTLSNGEETRVFVILREAEGDEPTAVIQAKYQGTNLQGDLLNSGLGKPASVLTVTQANEVFNSLISEGFTE